MWHEGDISVLTRLFYREGRTGLLVLSGGMRGIVGAAEACAFEERSLRNNFTVIEGGSSGAATALCFAAGMVRRGVRIYTEECCSRKYLSWSPLRALRGTTCDVEVVISALRPIVPLDALKTCVAEVCIAVTNHETGKGELLDAKIATPDALTLLHASIAMPHIYRKPIYVNGRRYMDANGAMIFPAEEIIERWQLDQIVVLANRPRHWKQTLKRRVLEKSAIALLPKQLSEPSARRHHLFEENYEAVTKIPHLILWMDDDYDIEFLTQDSSKLERARDRAYDHMNGLLDRAGV